MKDPSRREDPGGAESETSERATAPLPRALSVLFVDDDPILRKLFSRKLRTVAPEWTVREAANGETALVLVEQHSFDLIFMDQYMASVEKQVRLQRYHGPRSSRRHTSNSRTPPFPRFFHPLIVLQLLGTETVQALRSRGVASRICGLSANDKEGEFLRAGADAFCIKPFPCEREAMAAELRRILRL
jgi:CheY-like chemotaxis protein